MGPAAMAVLKFREAEETGMGKSAMWRPVERVCISAELTENGAASASLTQLPALETIATSDLATKLAAADDAISNLQQLLGEVRISYDELRRTSDDLKRDRDEWRRRAERVTERPWWRRLAG